DVVVDVDPGPLPLGDDEARGGQWFERRLIDARERRATGAGQLLERVRVEFLDELRDRDIELVDAEEASMAKPGQDPPLRDEDAGFDLRLVAWLARSRRDDRRVVVAREIEERRVDVRVVPIGPADGAAELVGYEHLGRAAEVLEPAHDRADEVGDLLR